MSKKWSSVANSRSPYWLQLEAATRVGDAEWFAVIADSLELTATEQELDDDSPDYVRYLDWLDARDQAVTA
jgi:hypothetical protein